MSPSVESLEIFCSLHRGVMLLQRRMRGLRAQVEFPLDSVSAIILLWIGYQPTLHFGELQRFLKIPKATLSRLLKNLVTHGYLISRISDADSRKKTFEYTKKGMKLLEELEAINNRLVRVGACPLNPAQMNRIISAEEAIATGLGAPIESSRPGEEPLFTQIRRISRVSGMVGSNYLGTNHDVMIYHIFSELGFSAQPTPLQFFIKHLRIPPSSLSREISKLVSKGWIQKENVRHDRKLILLKLTDKGWKHFRSCEETIGRTYREALTNIPLETITEWTAAFEPLKGLDAPTFNDAPLKAERCTDEESLRRVRAFIVEQLVKTGRHTNLPNTILPTTQLCIAVREADTILGIGMANEKQDGPEAVFASFLLAQGVTTPQLAQEIFAKAAECLRGAALPFKLANGPVYADELPPAPAKLSEQPPSFCESTPNPAQSLLSLT